MHYVLNKKTAKKSHNSDMESIWQIENHWQASTYTSHICICFALHLLWNWISWGFPWQLLLLFVLFPLFFCLCAWCTTWRMGNLFAICRGWLEKWNEIKCSRLRNWEEEFGKNLFFRAFCSNFRIEHPLSGVKHLKGCVKHLLWGAAIFV